MVDEDSNDVTGRVSWVLRNNFRDLINTRSLEEKKHAQHTREKSGIRGGNALTSRYLGARDRGVAGKP